MYKSDVTGKIYNSEKDLLKAEAEASEAEKRISLEKKARAEAVKRVQNKLTAFSTARKEFQEELSDFCKKYGAFKTSLTKEDTTSLDFFDDFLFNPFKYFD